MVRKFLEILGISILVFIILEGIYLTGKGIEINEQAECEEFGLCE